MSLPTFSLSSKSIVLAIVLVLSAWGIYTFQNAPRREDPEFHIRTSLISCLWPGAPVRDVELLVTDPIEEAVSGINEVKEIRSYSRVGQSVLYIDVEENIDDTDNVWDEITARLGRVDMPSGAYPPRLNRSFGDTSVMVLALHPVAGGKRYSPAQLHDLAKRVRDRLHAMPAVATTRLDGVRQERVFVQTSLKTWSQIGLTTGKLEALVKARNIIAPGGIVQADGMRFGVKPTGNLDAVQQLRRLVIGFNNGERREGNYSAPVFLDDIGLQVERGYADPPGVIARFLEGQNNPSSKNAVYLSFTMKDDANATELGHRVRQLLDELEATILPPDVGVTIVANQPEIVRQKIATFLSNLMQAVIIVIILALVLLGWRIAIVMASAVPVVMLIAIGISHFFGVDIEQVSIASLIIALGLLVDNAIEVGDNTLRLLEDGYDRQTAARMGPEQVGTPMLFGTLTTVAVFFPMLSIPGTTGEFIYSLPVVVSITLLTSWIIAMSMTTIMSYWMLRPAAGGVGHSPLMQSVSWLKNAFSKNDTQATKENDESAEISALRRAYGSLCRASIRLRWIVVAAAFGLFALSIWLVASGRIGTQFFPPNHRSQFTIDIFTPQGSSIYATDDIVRRVEALLQDTAATTNTEGQTIQRLDNAMVLVGQGGPRFYTSRAPEPPASNYGFILVNTINPGVVADYMETIRLRAKEEIPGARIIPRALMYGPPVEAPIAIRYVGEDIPTLRRFADQAKAVLRRQRGTWDIHDSWGVYSYQLRVRVDEERANLAGVSNAAIARSMAAYYSGHPLGTFREGDKKIPILFRLMPEERHSLSDIARLYVEGRNRKVPLNAVAEVEPMWQPSKIQRIDGQRMIEVRSRTYPGFLPNTVLHDALPEIREINRELPPTAWMEIAGEQKETTDSQRDVFRAFKISLVAIILLLIFKFNSFSKTMVILLTVPLAATGAFFGLYITNVPLGFMANLGLLSLTGVILNDAILLVEFIGIECKKASEKEENRDEDGVAGLRREAFREAVVQAGKTRLIPLSLTSLTTVGGLIPLLIFGGPMWSPLCVVLIFGLLLGTVLALLVFPPAVVIAAERLGLRIANTQDKNEQNNEKDN